MKKELKILVLASSNAAVDVITRRLLHARNKIDSRHKKDILNIVRFGILDSMHEDVRRIAPESLVQQTNLQQSHDHAHLSSLVSQRNLLINSIEQEKKNNSANCTVIGDNINDKQKRLECIQEAINKITEDEPSDIKGIMDKARIVCSTLSSSINLNK